MCENRVRWYVDVVSTFMLGRPPARRDCRLALDKSNASLPKCFGKDKLGLTNTIYGCQCGCCCVCCSMGDGGGFWAGKKQKKNNLNKIDEVPEDQISDISGKFYCHLYPSYGDRFIDAFAVAATPFSLTFSYIQHNSPSAITKNGLSRTWR